MHACPRCGMDCDCSGDIDDVSVMNDTWVNKNCTCDCTEFECDFFDREDDDDSDLDDSCPHCGREYDEIDYEYQMCHFCKYENQEE